MTEFDFEGVFDEDYLYFYEEMLTERTPEELKRIVELRGFHDALKPGGRLVLETQNVSRILLNPQPMHVVGERDGDVMIDRWELDAENARFLTQRLVMRGGRARKAHFSVRWFTPPELRSWLEEAGFENVRMPGLTAETRLVVVADRTS